MKTVQFTPNARVPSFIQLLDFIEADLRPERAILGLEKADLGSERAKLWPEGADVGPKRGDLKS